MYTTEEIGVRHHLAHVHSDCTFLPNDAISFSLSTDVTIEWHPHTQPKYVKTLNSGSCIFKPYWHVTDTPTVFVCEGIFDAMALAASGHRSVAVLGCSINDTLASKLVAIGAPLTLAFDQDEAGLNGMRQAQLKYPDIFLGTAKPISYKMSNDNDRYKDWFECYMANGCGEVGISYDLDPSFTVAEKYTRAKNSRRTGLIKEWYYAAKYEEERGKR